MLFSSIRGMEVIDKNGERIGRISDIDIEKGRVRFLVVTPAGVLGKVVNLSLKVPYKLVDSIGDVVFVGATLEEIRKA